VDILDYQRRAAQDRASALAAVVAAREDLGLCDTGDPADDQSVDEAPLWR
jgi:hypothetical protein